MKDFNIKFSGSMCPELCSLNTVKPQSCASNHHSKEVVFHADFRDGLPLLVKGRHLDIEAESENIVSWVDEEGNEMYPSSVEFSQMIQNHLAVKIPKTKLMCI